MSEPTDTVYYSDGTISILSWKKNGVLHREDGPARIEYHLNGRVRTKEWRIDGNLHREEFPAIVDYHRDGAVYNSEWRIDGKLHRECKPAIVRYFLDGSQCSHRFYNQGKDITIEVSEYLRENELIDFFKISLDIPLDHSIIMKMKFW